MPSTPHARRDPLRVKRSATRSADGVPPGPSPRPGVPVLVLTGAGMAAAVRLRTVPVLAAAFEVLTLHAGGTGAIERVADEAAAALAAAGHDAAHVYGLSFGGMVAQALAIRHPDRVRSLVLGATSAGGARRTPPDLRTAEFLRRRADMPVEEGLWAAVPYSYALATRRRHAMRIGEDIAQRRRQPVDPQHRRVQRAAALEWAAEDLHAIQVPTLVLHGAEDRMVPPDNGRALAAAIRGARELVLDDAAHLYPTDAPRADRAVMRFLRDRAATGRRPRRSGGGRAARA
jgi:pimeloyl-ACP methyl ester carboxylesterase